ncbi:hypothetical protein QBC45DRAFT_422102 [Copromyces sp. CBS 386.78]|nr:hypothetical protein QBC45DRAFT_422102 [Copromyces sp. CBS 386.78]
MMVIHPAADLLGRLVYDTEAQNLATSGLFQLDSATGAPYKTWEDLYGPVSVTGDEMELNMLAANKSNPVDGKAFYLTGSTPNEVLPEQPFKTENVVVLTNGICISTYTPGSLTNDVWQAYGRINATGVGILATTRLARMITLSRPALRRCGRI